MGRKDHLLRVCAGTCGRMTRTSMMSPEIYPDTVTRVGRGMCSRCHRAWVHAEGIPDTSHAQPAKEVDATIAAREIDAYTAARRARLAAKERKTHASGTGAAVHRRGPAAVRPAGAPPGAGQVPQGAGR